MAVVIQIREIECSAEGQWRVMLSCGSRSIERTLTDPFSKPEKNRLKWILDDHPNKFPFDLDRAKGIWDDIQQYAASIVGQLNLGEFVEEVMVSCKGTDALVEIVDSTSSALHSLYWEILEQQSVITTPQPTEIRIIITRAVLSNRDDPANSVAQSLLSDGDKGRCSPKLQRKYNILLVISRPRKEDDIDPLLGAKALNDVISELFSDLTEAPVNLEIVRPGSWKAFEQYIRERTDRWWRAGGRGSWFDVVHFDVHGIIHDGSPWLQFLSASGKTLLRSADLVAEVLVRHKVPLVVLHACESAKETTQRMNLAKILVEHGIERVVAMAYKLTSTAAQIFIRTFYYHLLADRTRNPLPALHAARSMLFRNPARLGKLDQEVFLPDYFVPVIYNSADVTVAQESSDDVFHTSMPQIQLLEAVRSFGMSFADSKLTHGVLGREQDILNIEWLLLREGHPNIALIIGLAGMGKTTLVNFLGNWWTRTKLISDFKYWSLKEDSPSKVVRYLRAWDVCRPTSYSRSPRLFIIDHMDAATGIACPSRWKLDHDQKRQMSEIFQAYRNRTDLIIVVSRTSEDWLKLEKSQKYFLKGLSNTDALALASRIMNAIGWGSFLDEPATLEQIECFASRVDYNPLSIDFFLRGSKDHVDWIQRSGLANLAEFTLDRPDNLLPDNPEHLLHYLLLAFVSDLHLPESLAQCQESFNYVKHLYNGEDTRSQLVLLSLLPLSGIYCEDWYMAARIFWLKTSGSTWEVPDEQYFRQFVTEKLVSAGWAECIGSIAMDDSIQYRCIRIHPVFINCLRLMVSLSHDLESFANGIWLTYVVHETNWAYLHTDWRRWKEWRRQVQLRATSLLAACAMGFNIATLNADSNVKPYYVHITLNLLWLTAIGSSTPALSPTMLSLKMEQLLDLAEKRLVAGKDDDSNLHNRDHVGANIDVMLRTCGALSIHFLQISPQKSAAILERLIKQVAMVARRGGVNWDHNERRFTLANSLTTFSNCCLGRGEFKRARRLASLALRCHKSEDSKLERLRDIEIRTKAYYTLTIVAIMSEVNSATTRWYAHEANAALGDRNGITDVDLTDIHPQLQLQKSRNNLDAIENQEVGEYLSEMPEAAKIRRLVDNGDVDAAKTALYDGIDEAQRTGIATAEGAFHAELAEICMQSKNWRGAYVHIQQLNRLIKMKKSGPWTLPHYYDPSDMYDCLYRYARYGSVFLRLKMFLPAMVFFWRALDAVRVVDGPDCALPDDPDHFVDVAMTILRANLCMLVGLPRKLISPVEFNELDDLGQELVISHVKNTWPDFDLAGMDIARRLNRAYDVREAPDVGGPPRCEPRSHNVITLTNMVVGLSMTEENREKLVLGFSERGLERQPNLYDMREDPDLNAIEDIVAFSRGIVRPENPRDNS